MINLAIPFAYKVEYTNAIVNFLSPKVKLSNDISSSFFNVIFVLKLLTSSRFILLEVVIKINKIIIQKIIIITKIIMSIFLHLCLKNIEYFSIFLFLEERFIFELFSFNRLNSSSL